MFLMYSTLHIKKDNLHYTFVAKSIRHNIITDIESLHSEMLHAKLLYISHALSNFYGTEIANFCLFSVLKNIHWGHCVLKWGFTRKFPRNHDTTLK